MLEFYSNVSVHHQHTLVLEAKGGGSTFQLVWPIISDFNLSVVCLPCSRKATLKKTLLIAMHISDSIFVMIYKLLEIIH